MQQSDRARDVLREDRVHQRTGEARLSSGHEARSRAGRAFEQETSRPSVREWFEDPDEEIHGVEATEPISIVETMRVGWLVRISDADGPNVFEQQAYVTERDGQIDWMRVMCSGWIPLAESSP